ncbi:ABC-2 type transport system permease protein [Ilumatobacter fluminis]|uniref:ABC-2 type transport system permease protein n=1 Tax=Ilumatobacter fluminis TaxID=467091 RepID=A0A4R7I5P2_9ACTN|nr:ABC transporter permease [Ilumatobacter fluminis]TDT18690.1 ABC-2 type transport system permease protein [Ilumatobacter fluminis]
MSARTTRLVIEREVREAARRKGIWALVLLTFLGSLTLVLLPEVLPDGDDNDRVMIVGDDDLGLAEALEAVDDPRLEVSVGVDRNDIADAIAAEEVDVGVVIAPRPVLVVEDENSVLVDVVAGVVADRVVADRLTDAGIDPAEVREAFASAAPSIEPVDAERGEKQASAFLISMVLYLLTVILTSQVASGVAVEKANRVSEVLLAIVPPRSLLFGKVIGVGCIGLLTLTAAATPVVVKFAVGGDLPSGLMETLLASSIWFIGGLALFLTLAGAMGSLVSRQEEAGSVVVPLTMILVVGYLAALSAGDSTLGTVLAYFPLTSPMVVPYRVAVEAGSIVEYTLSAVLLYATVFAAARIGAIVFRRAIVRTGRRLTLREVLR